MGKRGCENSCHCQINPKCWEYFYPARAAKLGGGDAVSLINTINSIMGIDLDNLNPKPNVGGKVVTEDIAVCQCGPLH